MATTPPTSLSSKLLVAFSSLLLAHSCYSAHEHSSIKSSLSLSSAASTTNSSNTTSTLPLDITLETIIATLLLCIGITLSGWEFKPISWPVWAGQLEREKGMGQYEFLESRLGFLDIRAKRAEFGEWVREKNTEKTIMQ